MDDPIHLAPRPGDVPVKARSNTVQHSAHLTSSLGNSRCLTTSASAAGHQAARTNLRSLAASAEAAARAGPRAPAARRLHALVRLPALQRSTCGEVGSE